MRFFHFWLAAMIVVVLCGAALRRSYPTADWTFFLPVALAALLTGACAVLAVRAGKRGDGMREDAREGMRDSGRAR